MACLGTGVAAQSSNSNSPAGEPTKATPEAPSTDPANAVPATDPATVDEAKPPSQTQESDSAPAAAQQEFKQDAKKATLPPVIITTTVPADPTPGSPAPSNASNVPLKGTADTVTARKRTEEAKDVPFGLSVKSRTALENTRAYRVQEAVRDVPNVNIQGFGDGRSTSFFVRGVGALRDPLSPDDTSFVVYVDGVPQPLFASDVGFLDVEQIELLKGPQGTLFGRNTTAGALNGTTRKQGTTPEFSLRLEAGQDGHRLGEATASGPIIKDLLSARIALRFSEVDGLVDNTLTGNKLGEMEVLSGRGTLLCTPDPGTSVTFSFFADHDDRTFPFFVLRNTPAFPIASLVEDNASERRVSSGTLIFEKAFDTFRLKSTTGLTHLRTPRVFVDDTEGFSFARITGLAVSLFSINNAFTDWSEKRRTLSQEILFGSLPRDEVSWVAGASYFRSDFTADYLNVNGPFPILSGRRLNDLKTGSFAGFGEATVPIGNGFSLTLGARLTHEQKSYDLKYRGIETLGTVAAFRDAGTLDFTFVTGRSSLSYEVAPDSNAYLTVSRGYKSGGFPRLAVDAALGLKIKPFDPTTTWTYEAGYKYQAKDNGAFLEFAAFYNDVSKEHLLAFDPAIFSFRPENLDVETYGVELSAGARLLSVLNLTAGIGFTEARLVNIDPGTSSAGARDGNRPTNVPRFTASATLAYRQRLSELGLTTMPGHLFADLSWTYIGERAADVANNFFLDSYHMVGGRFGFEPKKDVEV